MILHSRATAEQHKPVGWYAWGIFVPKKSAWRGKRVTLQIILINPNCSKLPRTRAHGLQSQLSPWPHQHNDLSASGCDNCDMIRYSDSNVDSVYDDAALAKLRPPTKSNQFHIPQKKRNLPEVGTRKNHDEFHMHILWTLRVPRLEPLPSLHQYGLQAENEKNTSLSGKGAMGYPPRIGHK